MPPALAGRFFTFEGFPDSSVGKESTCNAGELGSISGLGRSPGEGNGYPLQYSGLKNSMDCIVHRVAKSQTQLSDFHLLYLSGYLGNPQALVLPYLFLLATASCLPPGLLSKGPLEIPC